MVVLCAACAPESEPMPDPTAAAEIGPAERLDRTLPAPSTEAPRYVGAWAASADACAEPAWFFNAAEVSTRGEVHCDFDTVVLTQTGYAIGAICTAQAPPTRHAIQLSFAEDARSMLVSGGPWGAPIALTHCGPLP